MNLDERLHAKTVFSALPAGLDRIEAAQKELTRRKLTMISRRKCTGFSLNGKNLPLRRLLGETPRRTRKLDSSPRGAMHA